MFKIDFSRAKTIASKMSNDALRGIASGRSSLSQQQHEMKAYAKIAMALQAGFSADSLQQTAADLEAEINAPQLDRQKELAAVEQAAQEYLAWKADR